MSFNLKQKEFTSPARPEVDTARQYRDVLRTNSKRAKPSRKVPSSSSLSSSAQKGAYPSTERSSSSRVPAIPRVNSAPVFKKSPPARRIQSSRDDVQNSSTQAPPKVSNTVLKAIGKFRQGAQRSQANPEKSVSFLTPMRSIESETDGNAPKLNDRMMLQLQVAREVGPIREEVEGLKNLIQTSLGVTSVKQPLLPEYYSSSPPESIQTRHGEWQQDHNVSYIESTREEDFSVYPHIASYPSPGSDLHSGYSSMAPKSSLGSFLDSFDKVRAQSKRHSGADMMQNAAARRMHLKMMALLEDERNQMQRAMRIPKRFENY